jgi:hypothetical protein
MLKISIVMLTTAVFAGLLIADRPRLLSTPPTSAPRAMIAAANAQTADGTEAREAPPVNRPAVVQPAVAGPLLVQHDNLGVKPDTVTPLLAKAKTAALSFAMAPRSRAQLVHHPVRSARAFRLVHHGYRHA